MRYIVLDQNGDQEVVDIISTVNHDKYTEFVFKTDKKSKSIFIRSLAGKLFASSDLKGWKKIASLNNVQQLTSISEILKLYRGFKPSGVGAKNAGALVAQMPGKVVKLMAKVGDKVSQGQTILILEAMKMENEIKAGASGILKNIAVKEGQVVESGLLLAEIENS